MTVEQLQEKRSKYLAMIDDLRNTDITAIVNNKLEDIRAKIEAEVKADIAKNLETCHNYLDVIDELITDEQASIEQPSMTSTSDCDTITEQYISQ